MHGTHHGVALLGALPAGAGAFCTMFRVRMLFTFYGTFGTKLCTQAANFFGPGASHTHQLGSAVTNGCAFHIKLDALGHHSHLFLLQAGRCAMVTNGGTAQAGVYALLKFVVAHTVGFYR